MRKYDELYAAIKKDRKKSAPTFNQELLKMFLSRRKNESGRGSKKKFDHKGKKRPRRCMDELNDDTDDDDDGDNYSDIVYDVDYGDVKKEAV
jgi:hypothetical protein